MLITLLDLLGVNPTDNEKQTVCWQFVRRTNPGPTEGAATHRKSELHGCLAYRFAQICLNAVVDWYLNEQTKLSATPDRIAGDIALLKSTPDDRHSTI